jgi:integrase
VKHAAIFSSVAGDWLRTLPNVIQDNGREHSASTLKVYARAVERAEKMLGSLPLDQINNEVIREFVAAMRAEEFSPATIRRDLTVIKLVVESVTKDGNPLYPLRINRKFARVPRIIPAEQHAPCATREDVERALSHVELAGPITVMAGVGLRISEVLSLRAADCLGLDSWDSENSIIHIRATLKTPAARRSIPVPPEINEFLQRISLSAPGELLFSVSRNRLYNLLEARDLPMPHAYRRYFATVRDEAGMNPGALKRIMGHSKGEDITARYSRAAENMDFLRSEMERAPIGFTLPVFAAPRHVERQIAIAEVTA